jgi:hypothetical protein
MAKAAIVVMLNRRDSAPKDRLLKLLSPPESAIHVHWWYDDSPIDDDGRARTLLAAARVVFLAVTPRLLESEAWRDRQRPALVGARRRNPRLPVIAVRLDETDVGADPLLAWIPILPLSGGSMFDAPDRDDAMSRIGKALQKAEEGLPPAKALRPEASATPADISIVEAGAKTMPADDVEIVSEGGSVHGVMIDEFGESAPTAAAQVGEEERYYWNTRFPDNQLAQTARLAVVNVAVRIETGIELASDSFSLGSVISAGELHEGGQRVDVQFEVVGRGMQVRRPGGDWQPRVLSPLLECRPHQRCGPFAVDAIATAAGDVAIDLTLLVNNAIVRRQNIALRALDATALGAAAATGGPSSVAPQAPGPKIDLARYACMPPVDARLDVHEQGDFYVIELFDGPRRFQVTTNARRSILQQQIVGWNMRLVKLSDSYRAMPLSEGDPANGLRIIEGETVIRAFAEIGSEMHEALFGHPDEPGSEDLKQFARRLARLGVDGTPVRLQVNAEQPPLPWGVLYDAAYRRLDGDMTSDNVDPTMFWGARFAIDRSIHSMDFDLPDADDDSIAAARLQPVVNTSIDNEQKIHAAFAQMAFFEAVDKAGVSDLEPEPPITSGDALVAFVKQPQPCRLIYFFCHAEAALTLNEYFMHPGQPPEEQAALILDASQQRLTVKELHKARRKPLPGRPLVFLNACGSARGDPAFPSMFLPLFLETWGASGFIGTDWKIPSVFADAFARRVLNSMIKGRQTVAQAFREATRTVVCEYRNPFPLIYALFVDPDETL